MDKKFRVAEIFGPTIQGEGRHAGAPCYFIRFGGCDYRCVWCDTPHAVLPEEVSKLRQMTAREIVNEVDALPGDPEWIVISGGNPALFDLEPVITELLDYNIMVETQGTIWKPWLKKVDELCISPKPPSSGMDWRGSEQAEMFMEEILADKYYWDYSYLKVVVFDNTDYEWAKSLHQAFRRFDFFLSVGNEDPTLPTVGNPHPYTSPEVERAVPTALVVLEKTKWLFEKVANDPDMAHVRVMPQLHTLAWGNARGR